MKKQEVKIGRADDKNISPAALLVQTANNYESSIFIDVDDKHINAKSIMGIMSLGLSKGVVVTVVAEGGDEEEAMTEMVKFLSNE